MYPKNSYKTKKKKKKREEKYPQRNSNNWKEKFTVRVTSSRNKIRNPIELDCQKNKRVRARSATSNTKTSLTTRFIGRNHFKILSTVVQYPREEGRKGRNTHDDDSNKIYYTRGRIYIRRMTVEDLISFRAQLSFDKSGSVRFPFYFCSFHQRSRSGMVEKRDKKRADANRSSSSSSSASVRVASLN